MNHVVSNDIAHSDVVTTLQSRLSVDENGYNTLIEEWTCPSEIGKKLTAMNSLWLNIFKLRHITLTP